MNNVVIIINQIKLKLELADPQVKSGKIQSMLRYWVTQLSSVINKTACRSILAGATSLIDASNSSSGDDLTSVQRDDQMAANSSTAHNFIEDMDLSMINQDHIQR